MDYITRIERHMRDMHAGGWRPKAHAGEQGTYGREYDNELCRRLRGGMKFTPLNIEGMTQGNDR